MHILILPSSYPRPYSTLAGIFYRDQALALQRNGIHVGVIDPEPRTLRTLLRQDVFLNRFQISLMDDCGIPTVNANDWCIPFSQKLYSRHFIWRAKRLFEYYVKHFGKPDIIHAHEILWGGVAARIIGKKNNIPFLVTEHSSNYAFGLIKEWQKSFIKDVMKDAYAIISVSSSFMSLLRSFGDIQRFRIVPNVVDTEFFSMVNAPKNDGLFRFISITPLTLKKGVDILVKAFASAFKERDDVVIEIGGEGEARVTIEQLVKDLGIHDRIKLLGLLSRSEVLNALHRSNAFVLPSYYETFGVTYIEAMSAGLPVIATKCGGPEDFVNDSNGYLVDVGSVEQTANAMKGLYNNRGKWQKRSNAIHNFIVERFSESAIARDLLGIYNEIMETTNKTFLHEHKYSVNA